MDASSNIVLRQEKVLPRFKKRVFVPPDADLRSAAQVTALFEKLLKQQVSDSTQLEQWLWDRSELESALDQEQSVLYIRMTCQTDHAPYATAYQDFVEQVSPIIRSYEDKLNRFYLAFSQRYTLNAERYHVYDRELRSDLDLFCDANIPKLTQLQILSQEYQKVCGGWTVEFEGKEQTLVALSRFLQDPDRDLREKTWRLAAQRRQLDVRRLDELFDQMFVLRQDLARNAGCKNFVEYQFRAYHRFDYTVQDCKEYHTAIQDLVVPLWKNILERRRQQMGLAGLRPWDLEVDSLGRSALKPFTKTEDLVTGVGKIFCQLRPDLGDQFDRMATQGLFDLANRKGKAPGGYQNMLSETRLPFIFMNAVGLDDDLRTLLHEGGHAFHSFACRSDPILSYRHGPLEFCEVASMSMELLGNDYLDMFYGPEEKERSIVMHLEGVIQLLIWVAIVDSFQHWIYENGNHTAQQRKAAWVNIFRNFGGNFVDWQGLENFQETLWQRQLHIFEVPFYYIEYGIAQLGALQVWLNARQDKYQALQKYMKALALGGSRPLPELFQTAGIKFDFQRETIAPLVEIVSKELKIS